jgi:hypothetical protein
MNKRLPLNTVLRSTTGLLIATVWASACATQYIAREFGFSDVLGPPLFRIADVGGLALILSHAGAAAAGAGAYVLIASGAWSHGLGFIAGASVLFLLGSGPFYSPHLLFVWVPAMWDEPALVAVLQQAFAVAITAALWAGLIIHAILWKEERGRKSLQTPAPPNRRQTAAQQDLENHVAASPQSQIGPPVVDGAPHEIHSPVQGVHEESGEADIQGPTYTPEDFDHDPPAASNGAFHPDPARLSGPNPNLGRGI